MRNMSRSVVFRIEQRHGGQFKYSMADHNRIDFIVENLSVVEQLGWFPYVLLPVFRPPPIAGR